MSVPFLVYSALCEISPAFVPAAQKLRQFHPVTIILPRSSTALMLKCFRLLVCLYVCLCVCVCVFALPILYFSWMYGTCLVVIVSMHLLQVQHLHFMMYVRVHAYNYAHYVYLTLKPAEPSVLGFTAYGNNVSDGLRVKTLINVFPCMFLIYIVSLWMMIVTDVDKIDACARVCVYVITNRFLI